MDRDGPTSPRTARRLWAAASRSISSVVGRRGAVTAGPVTRASGGGRLQVVELLADARDHRREIGAEHHQVEAALDRAPREGRARAVHGRLLAVLVGRVADLVAGGDVHRVRVVATRGESEGER